MILREIPAVVRRVADRELETLELAPNPRIRRKIAACAREMRRGAIVPVREMLDVRKPEVRVAVATVNRNRALESFARAGSRSRFEKIERAGRKPQACELGRAIADRSARKVGRTMLDLGIECGAGLVE